jgi:signal transduction histidine kinase/GAF domain-containing protein
MNAEKGGDRASLELLYHISRELASALDLPTVLERVLRLSVQNVGAANGSLIVLDKRGEPLDSALLVGPEVHGDVTQQLQVVLERGLSGWVARSLQPALVVDTRQDERWLQTPAEAGEASPKSAVSAPVLARDELVGVITLVHPTPGFFTGEHLSLVQAIAGQAGIAILNARLLAESQQKARVMSALAESAASITSSLQLEDVLQRILEETSQALQVESVSLALIEPDGQELVFRAASGEGGEKLRGVRLAMGQGVAGWVAQEGSGVIIPDVLKEKRFFPEVDRQTGFHTRALACAPMRDRGQVIGVLEAVNPQSGTFDPDDLLVLTGIGSLAGTAIRHAQLFERLQAAHQRYRELFEDSIDPILITDLEGRIQEANRQASRLTGLPAETIRGLNIQDLGITQEERVGAGYAKIPPGEPLNKEPLFLEPLFLEPLSYESNLDVPNREPVPVQVYTRRVSIDGHLHLQWILHDLTERKKLDTWRDDLLAMIYHDLRSPLSNVVSSLDMLEMVLPLEDYPAVNSVLGIAARSTQRIQRLTNSLLDIRRLEAGQPVGDRQLVAPRTLAEDASAALQPGKGHRIEIDIPTELPQVYVDGEMVRRVLINLLENAIKYAPPSSTITLGARDRQGEVEMWVQDSGPGVPNTERERIFEKYTRVDLPNRPKGLGLGLAYCRLAVEGHGGRIWVESEPGKGSCFRFTLPSKPLPIR